LAPTPARIASIARHDSGVRTVSLEVEAPFAFRAGQYLYVVHPDGVRIPMSIASAPERLPQLELHFRPLPGVGDATLMLELLDRRDVPLILDGPFGEVHVAGPLAADLTLFAGGSGISQCRSIVEHLRGVGHARRVRLVWSVTQLDHLYCDAELRRFASWLDYMPLVDSPEKPNAAVAWIDEHRPTLSGRVVVAGGPGFVYAIVDALERIGRHAATIESDVFAYAPRVPSAERG
jgi:CDP-4-dehydro-6-deoxyglucose reductase